MTGMEKAKFLSACSVLLVRILCMIPAFENLKKQIPVHIPMNTTRRFPQDLKFFHFQLCSSMNPNMRIVWE